MIVDMEDPVSLVVLGTTVLCGAVMAVYLYKLANGGPPKLLPLEDFANLPLIAKDILSHDTRRFTFGLPAGHVLGLPTGQHVALQFKQAEGGKVVQRSYTPVTDDRAVGRVSLVIKVYRPLPPKFPLGGLMSQHLDDLKLGETIRLRGPKGHLHWIGGGRGSFTVKPLGKPVQERTCRAVALIAGGTGITPMLQILHAIFEHPGNSVNLQVKLLYANQTPEDILVRPELEALHAKYGDRFQLWYTVDRVEGKDAWTYDTGFIDTAMVQKHLLFDSEADRKATQFFLCGPPPMLKFACLPALKECGYSEKDWVVF
jgi:cytochrome-b5 reductase